LEKEILFFDGAMGTMLRQEDLKQVSSLKLGMFFTLR
jgi:methionine synthase I (cobalamin-dependent)